MSTTRAGKLDPSQVLRPDAAGATVWGGETPRPTRPTPAPDHKAPAEKADPTRYGDWVKNGRAIDF